MNENKINLCCAMLIHAYHSDKLKDYKASEIHSNLLFFFDIDIVDESIKRVTTVLGV